MLDELRELAGDRLVLVPYDEPFNFSEKMNLGVLHATGDRFVLLNDDVEVDLRPVAREPGRPRWTSPASA